MVVCARVRLCACRPVSVTLCMHTHRCACARTYAEVCVGEGGALLRDVNTSLQSSPPPLPQCPPPRVPYLDAAVAAQRPHAVVGAAAAAVGASAVALRWAHAVEQVRRVEQHHVHLGRQPRQGLVHLGVLTHARRTTNTAQAFAAPAGPTGCGVLLHANPGGLSPLPSSSRLAVSSLSPPGVRPPGPWAMRPGPPSPTAMQAGRRRAAQRGSTRVVVVVHMPCSCCCC